MTQHMVRRRTAQATVPTQRFMMDDSSAPPVSPRHGMSVTTDDMKHTDIVSAHCRVHLRVEDATCNEDGRLDLPSAAAIPSSTFFLLGEFADMPLATAMQRTTGAPEMPADVACASRRMAIDGAA